VVDITAMVADGLWFAHQQDIVHRDVKPSNIMVMKGGIAKITDFGIARLPNSAVKTMTGLILGSPRYMSPEQVIGKTIDARSDIFSLGVVLYEALTGVAPFDGDNVNAIMYATVNTTPPPPSSHNRHIPAMLDLIVAKAMAKLLEDRYQSIKELGDDLREVRRQWMPGGRPRRSRRARRRPRASPGPHPPRAARGYRHVPDGNGEGRGEGRRARRGARAFEDLRLLRRDAAARRDDRPDRGLPRLHHADREDARLSRQDRAGHSARAQGGVHRAAQDGLRQSRAHRHAARARRRSSRSATNLLAIGVIVILTIAAIALAIALVVK
jgi:serine/threonine-protein kinase